MTNTTIHNNRRLTMGADPSDTPQFKKRKTDDHNRPDNLVKRINEALELTFNNKDFYPEEELKSVLSKITIIQELSRASAELSRARASAEFGNHASGTDDFLATFFLRDEKHAEYIHKNLIKTFATLVLLGHSHLIVKAIDSKHSDKWPMSEDDAKALGFPKKFFRVQYRFYPVIFSENDMKKKYETHFVLPILEKRMIAGGSGHFGTVYEVKVHPKCDRIRNSQLLLDYIEHAEPHVYACKELHDAVCEQDSQTDIETFLHDVVKTGQSTGYNHIMPLLANYTYNDIRYLLFPRAECDLETFMNHHSSHTETKRLEMLDEISKVASALMAIHNLHKDPAILKRFDQAKTMAVHRDITPRNILKLGDRFMLADFGVARISPYYGGISGSPLDQGNLEPYLDPQVMNGGQDKRMADVWALGCVFMEFLTYIMRGTAGLLEFTKERKRAYKGIAGNEGHPHLHEWYFFDRATGRPKDTVIEWLEKLQVEKVQDEGLGTAVKAFVGIIKKMLRLDDQQHDINQIWKDLRSTFHKAHQSSQKRCLPDAEPPILSSYASGTLLQGRRDSLGELPRLTKCDVVFLVHNTSTAIRKHWEVITSSVMTFAGNARLFDKDGVDIHVTGDDKLSTVNLKSSLKLMEILEEARKHEAGESTVISKIDEILSDYIYKYEKNRLLPGLKPRWLNLIVVSLGHFANQRTGGLKLDDELRAILQRITNRLELICAPEVQVGIQFVVLQTEDTESLLPVFEELDNLPKVPRDIVDFTVYDHHKDRENVKVITKLLCGANCRYVDQEDELRPATEMPNGAPPILDISSSHKEGAHISAESSILHGGILQQSPQSVLLHEF